MKSIRRGFGGHRRLRTLAAVVTVVGVAGTFAAVRIPANAAIQDSYNKPTIRTSAEARSVFISGTGFATWRVGQQTGQVGASGASVGLGACYTYVNGNSGDFTEAQEFYVYVNEAPGSQGPKPPDPNRPETVQFASPFFDIGSTVTALSFTTENCSNGLLNQVKGIPVTSAGPEAEELFPVDLVP